MIKHFRNFQISARRLSFQYSAPWRLLWENSNLLNHFHQLAAAPADAAEKIFQNRGQLKAPPGLAEGLFDLMLSLKDKLRLYFIQNCAGDSIEKNTDENPGAEMKSA